MKTKTQHRFIGAEQIALFFESDVHNGEYLDTKVTINGELICWIAGSDIDKFTNELNQVITKYRI